jgi:sugar O-acyltransferase (sialic acid O-acetyltransferase NeuD family)
MVKPNMILIGAGGHAHACIDVIESQGIYQIAGLVGKISELRDYHLSYEVIASDAELPELAKIYKYALIAVGHMGLASPRIHLYQQAIAAGFELPTVIAATAYVSPHASVGTGTIVMHGATLNAGARVGNNCIINSHALVEHDARVDDHCHLSTGAILNGNVHVQEGAFVGSGSVIKEGITVGRNCLVGMGLSVRHNQPDQARFVGKENK